MFSEQDLLFPVDQSRIESALSGAFRRRVLVLARAESERQTEYLRRILEAARLNLEQDTLFAEIQAGENADLIRIVKAKQPEAVLVFGLQPRQLGMALEPAVGRLFEFYGATWLWSDALSVLEPDKTRRAALWTALQQLFIR